MVIDEAGIKDLRRGLRAMVRVGKVSSLYPERNTAKVTFEDKDSNVSQELNILNRGAARNKDYWMPDVEDEVVCLFAMNDKNLSTGWIVGAHFSEKHPPQAKSADVMRLDFADGGYVEYDRAKSSMEIHCPGTIRITAGKLYLNK